MTSLTSELTTGDGRLLTVSDVVQLYRDFVNLSAPCSGKIQRLGENAFSLTNYFSTTDCDSMESIKTLKVYSLLTKTSESENSIESVRCVSDAHEVTELLSATSKSGRFTARLKAATNSDKSSEADGPNKQILEIWDRSRLVKAIDTSELESHGSINVDQFFSKFLWSKYGEQDKLLYVCQRKRPKHSSFFKNPSTLIDRSGDSSHYNTENKSPVNPSTTNLGEEFNRIEDWGECLAGIERTIIAVLDVSNNCKITTIEVEGYCLADPQWLDNGTKIVSVAYEENVRKLGLIYCNNRASKITVHDWQSSTGCLILELASKTECFHDPRVNNAGDKFIYLSNPIHGVHHHSMKMNLYDFKTGTVRRLEDTITGKDEFFIDCLPVNCFTTNDKYILLKTRDHLYLHMCLYSLERSSLSKIKFPTSSLSILDFQYDIILASGSEANATPALFVAVLNLQNANDVVAWYQIEDCIHMDDSEYETYVIPTPDQSSFVSALLVKPNLRVLQQKFPGRPTERNKPIDYDNLPTIVSLHGGPHSSTVLDYSTLNLFYARLGLKVLWINYRGSSGVSEEYLQSLCGKIGRLDVDDCLHVIRYMVQNKVIDPSKLVISGGSHGGFLSCHLSCQEEFKFTSAIIRNPVVEISSMCFTSDIPDWTYNEALGHEHYDYTCVPTSEDLVKMYQASPMSVCTKAHVPTLMLLGSKDLRVKMFQGERWIENLRARGVETSCKVYPDRHMLGKPAVRADSTISSALWILNHLPKTE